MARVVILGGGFGGLAAATELEGLLGSEHEIVVLDRREQVFIGLRKLWAMVGLGTLEEGSRPLERLEKRGIRFLHTEIRRIVPEARRVETGAGDVEGDYLIVALGAEPRADLVPGLSEHGYDLYDAAVIPRLAQRVAGVDRGAVGVVIAGIPYKCPPAPYEATLLLHEHFARRGVRDRVQLTFTTLQPSLLPNAGRPGHERMEGEFGRRGIAFRVGAKVKAFESGRVVFEDGDLPLDLAIGVPPHRPPAVVAQSALAGEGGWIHVNPRTLETGHPGVFAIGDVTHIPLAGGAALPKAGLFAEAHAERVARAIVARIRGEVEPPPFDGRGYCYLETGYEEAALVQGEFFAEPAPTIEIAEASREHAEAKRRFESERLERWLGG